MKELIAKAAEYLDWLTSSVPGPKPEEVKELVAKLYDLAERQPVSDARKVESARVSDDPKYDWRAPSSPEDTTLDDLVTELRKNARFNQAWADGVLGKNESTEYRQTRQMFADQYNGWAEAVVALMAEAEPPVVNESFTTEPVGEVRFELGPPSSVYAELYSETLPLLAPGAKLYASPQPAPDVATGQQPFKSDIAETELERRLRRDLKSMNETVAVLHHHNRALVEALERAIGTLDDCDMNLFHDVIHEGREALAAYRQGGGE